MTVVKGPLFFALSVRLSIFLLQTRFYCDRQSFSARVFSNTHKYRDLVVFVV